MAASCSASFSSLAPSRFPTPPPGCLFEGWASLPCPGEFSACCDSLLRSGSCSSPPAWPLVFSPFCCLPAFFWPCCLLFCCDACCCCCCCCCAPDGCCFMLDSRFCTASRILLRRLEELELLESCPPDCWFWLSFALPGRLGFSSSEVRSCPWFCWSSPLLPSA